MGHFSENEIACPLCGSNTLHLLESLKVDCLSKLYRRRLGIALESANETFDYYACVNCGFRFFQPVEAGNEVLYEKLQAFDWYYLDRKFEFDFAARYLPERGTVLEVGAGAAAFVDYIGGNRYVGIEFNNKAIERAHSQGIELIKESIESHAKTGKLYDAVVSFQVLEHVQNPLAFLKACVSCLAPNGVLIIAVPGRDGFISYSVNNILDLPPHHLTHWSRRVFQEISNILNLEIVAMEYEPVADYHKAWARTTLWNRRLRSKLKLPDRLLDCGFCTRAIKSISALLGFLVPPSLCDVAGHTLICVYRKK